MPLRAITAAERVCLMLRYADTAALFAVIFQPRHAASAAASYHIVIDITLICHDMPRLPPRHA